MKEQNLRHFVYFSSSRENKDDDGDNNENGNTTIGTVGNFWIPDFRNNGRINQFSSLYYSCRSHRQCIPTDSNRKWGFLFWDVISSANGLLHLLLFFSTQKWPTGRIVNNAKVPNRLGHIHVESQRCHLHSIRCSRFEGTEQASALSTFGRCRSRRSNWCTEVSGESCVFFFRVQHSIFGYAFFTWDQSKKKSSFSPFSRSFLRLFQLFLSFNTFAFSHRHYLPQNSTAVVILVKHK